MQILVAEALLITALVLLGLVDLVGARPTDLLRIQESPKDSSIISKPISSVDDLGHKSGSSELTAHIERRLPPIPIPLHPRLYNDAKDRGKRLLVYFTELPPSQESPWKNFDDLAACGWSGTLMTHQDSIAQGTKDLADVLTELSIDTTAPPKGSNAGAVGTVGYLWQHTGNTSHPGVSQTEQDNEQKDKSKAMIKYPATHGSYENIFNTKQGLIIARKNHAPVFQSNVEGVEFPIGAQITPLRAWSDVVYLTWMQLTKDAPEQRTNLRYVIRDCIDNPDSIKLIADVLRMCGESKALPFPGTLVAKTKTTKGIYRPGRTLPNGPWLALLGSPNARGVAWLLIQHGRTMGRGKAVGDIRVWNRGIKDEQILCMLIEIVNERL